MLGRSLKNRLYVFTGNDQLSLLVEIDQPGNPRSPLKVLGQTDTSPIADVSLPRLLTTAGSLRGNLAVVLPLHFFETVSVSLPAIPDGAIAQALPYQLAKLLPRPISDYIYDWQVTERLRDSLQLTVYLYNAKDFEKIKASLPSGRIEVKYLEADIFAACALLEKEQRLSTDHASLIVLIWQDNISLAVYDHNRLALVRTIQVTQPSFASEDAPLTQPESTTKQAGIAQTNDTPLTAATSVPLTDISESEILLDLNAGDSLPSPDPTAAAANTVASDDDTELIMAGWDIFNPGADDNEPHSPLAPSSKTGTTVKYPRKNYCRQVVLEIMRTRDYYVSVMKGRPINQIYLGSNDDLRQELKADNVEFLGLDLLPLYEEKDLNAESFPSLLRALTLGVGIR
ncbi:MAG TPA: hypothetical protein DEQ20_07620 [Desulfobulbaceae bacterium]|nr:MAG: hypothetical protein A2520_03920 [Deltaproteobacteria bacterium RIFOXYD12_FULL_53_23]HCC54775.1 hypothetical protein [Desulfobulbaceae bacterium]